MSIRRFGLLLGVGAVMALMLPASTPVQAQSGANGASIAAAPPTTPKPARKTLRTPWGDPDLQGVWDYKTITPLERPANMAGRTTLTDEEVNTLEARAGKRLDEPPDESVPATTIHAPYMTDPGRKVLDDRRTSLIIDPADGRVPPLTPEAERRLATRRAGGRDGGADGPESRSNPERCITYGFPNAILPTLYNNNIQILQGPGYVAITHEMIHETRIIALDGRAPLNPKIKQWFGDSKGRWEGDTLVVESRNFSDKTNYRGAGATLHTIERFTRIGKDAIDYRLTIDDPHTFVRPWTIALPMRTSEGDLYEYVCHEANLGLYGILEVARDEELAAAAAAKHATNPEEDLMERTLTLAAAGVALSLTLVVPVRAHHSFAAEFDANVKVILKGTVTGMDWVNPHAWIHLDVKNPDGTITPWDIETGTPNTLFRRGFTKDSLKAGTEIVVEGYRAKNGKPRANGRDLMLPNGKRLFLGSSGTGAPYENELKDQEKEKK